MARRPPGRRLERLTVQQWFLAVLVTMGAMVLAAALVGNALLKRTSEAADRLVYNIAPARTEAYRLQAALLDQESGVRGYVLTGDRRFLEPYTNGKAAEADAVARLDGLLRDEAVPTADVQALRRTAAGWRRDYADPVIAQVGRDGAKSVSPATEDRGAAIFSRLRGLWAAQDRHLREAASEGRADLIHNRTVRDRAFLAMLAAFLLTGALLAAVLHAMVLRPLGGLRAASRRVCGGEFSHTITGQGPADLRALADDVEAMRHRVVRELDSATERERLLQRTAAELDAQTVELRRSNAELEQFAYVASHDLQEPLRKITSFCQLLERRYRDRLDERGIQYIDFAVDGAKRMQVLINDLLTFSRVGRMHDERRTVALDDALDQALANLDSAREQADARIDRPDRLPEVTGDPTLLVLLWQNLIGNAIKFRAPDRPVHITIDCVERAGGWELAVTDNGIGIGAEFADKIFVIFQRLHTRDAYDGTGIGLALCKKIVEHHGGRIWLDTGRREPGTEIRFTLPRPDDAAAETAALTAQGAVQ